MSSNTERIIVLLSTLCLIHKSFGFINLDKETKYHVEGIDKSFVDLGFELHDRSKREAVEGTASLNDTATSEINVTSAPAITTSTELPATTPNWTKIEDTHIYYDSTVHKSSELNVQSYWLELSAVSGVVKHPTLSQSHRTASTIELSFNFPFYGHLVKKITIATGGFLYLSDFLHQWLTATQYVAPLMANFDTTKGDISHIYYLDTGSLFVVWWDEVYLQDEESAGPFRFQVHLYPSGVIHFVYKKIPKNPSSISSENHPVKIGLSDAYYFDNVEEDVRKRTIFEYHRVELDISQVKDDVAIVITPVPTCIMMTDCYSCVSAQINFNCQWCTSLKDMRCSDGLDRHRQEWLNSDCQKQSPLTTADCHEVSKQKSNSGKGDAGTVVAVVVTVILIVLLIGVVFGWFIYAYRNPNSDSGRWLIEHRPSQLGQQLNKVKFWKKEDAGEKYGVSVGGSESVA